MLRDRSRVFKAVLALLFVLALPGLVLADPILDVGAPKENYCIVPPYVKRDSEPNIMIIMDNSKFNAGPAYKNDYYYFQTSVTKKQDFLNFVTNTYYYGKPNTSAPSGYRVEDRYTDNVTISNTTYYEEFSSDILYTSRYYEDDAPEHYVGYFSPLLMYSNPNKRTFEIDSHPDDPDGPYFTGDNNTGRFSGAMLNWATTTMYDIIQAVLVGGMGVSPQTNVHTLISFNSGEIWNTSWLTTPPDIAMTPASTVSTTKQYIQTYVYEGWDSTAGSPKYYACDAIINYSGSRVDGVTFMDSQDTWVKNWFIAPVASYGLNYGSAPTCGLVNDARTPATAVVGPKFEYTISAITPSDGPYFAGVDHLMPEATGGITLSDGLGGLVDGLFQLANTVLNLLAPDAEAAKPLTLSNKQGGAISVPAAQQGSAYSTIFYATGGTGVYTFSMSTAIAGLTLDPSDGTLYGTPTTSGTITFTIRVTDSAGATDTATVNLVINPVPPPPPPPALTIVNPSISAFYISDGVCGSPYNFQFAASGGVPPYTWAITSHISFAAVTPGLSLLPSGLITGTIAPCAATYSNSFTYRVTDSVGTAVSDSVVHYVSSACSTLYFVFSDADATKAGKQMPSGSVGSAYNYTPTTFYGCPPQTWTITAKDASTNVALTLASLGLSYSTTTGTISGTPTAGGDFKITFKAVDSSVPAGISETMDLHLEPKPPTWSDYQVRVCVGDYDENCVQTTKSTNERLITGLLHEYWGQAHFGFIDFDNADNPNLGLCTDQVNDVNFYNMVQNALPQDYTKLVDALYDGLKVFSYPNGTNCDAFSFDPLVPCMSNYLLILTGGLGADNPKEYYPTATPKLFTTTPLADMPYPDYCKTLKDNGSINYNLSANACYGFYSDFRKNPAEGDPDNPPEYISDKQNVSTFVVNAMGTNEDILAEATEVSSGNYYKVTDPGRLKSELVEAFKEMLKRAASGTAASVLASGEGSGANLVQAVYYPRKGFENISTVGKTEIAWIGVLSNYWYYVDPLFANNNIREETVTSDPPVLNLVDDIIMEFKFDRNLGEDGGVLAIKQKDVDGDGDGDLTAADDPSLASVAIEDTQNIWEAGRKLWERDLATQPRTIYANIDDTAGMTLFNTPNAAAAASSATVQALLQVPGDAASAQKIIRYINGEDLLGYRNRTVQGMINNSTEDNVWKLGDVVNSTPKIASWQRLNDYDDPEPGTCIDASQTCPLGGGYGDCTYTEFYNDPAYADRGVVFAGGNDGMMHAFKLGKLELSWVGQDQSVEMSRLTGAGLGEELWAFIPKNVLPYLKYQMDPGYCHMYTVDLSPFLLDVSIGVDWAATDINGDPQPGSCTDDYVDEQNGYHNCLITKNSWRTVLIGGLRYGGACDNAGASCTVDTNNDGVVDSADCVKTPVNNVGYSSYFALDITDPENPQLLWEFANDQLGFSTTGPAPVRINATDVDDIDGDGNVEEPLYQRNGMWYVVIGSGPTGPIEPEKSQFLGNSDQNLRYFVLDMKTGKLVHTIDTGLKNAYSGSLLDATNDTDYDYSDEAIYSGYVIANTTTITSSTRWTNGGVGRILTGKQIDPAKWQYSTLLEDVGPVTASIARLQNDPCTSGSGGTIWLFAATGRYFYILDRTPDDPASQRHIFGFTDPCFAGNDYPDPACTDKRTLLDMTDVTDLQFGDNNPNGWYIRLDLPNTIIDEEGIEKDMWGERVITDIQTYPNGVVYTTTFQPYVSECDFGGESFLWALDYKSGGDVRARLKGSVIMQVSTGAIEKIDLATAFTDKQGRRAKVGPGVPPMQQGFSVFSTPQPTPQILYLIERD